MVHFPHILAPAYTPKGGESQQGTAVTKSSTQNTEISKTVVNESPEGGRTTLSASLRTSYSYSETYYTPSRAPTTDIYEQPAVQDNPAELTDDGVGRSSATNAVDRPTTSNVGAATVLAFIEQRLTVDNADGIATEGLQARLGAGLEGFLQGYNEAVEQLREMGLYEGEVQIAVEQMFNQVLSGFAELADQYGLENPAAALQAFDLTVVPDAEAVASVSDGVRLTPTDYVADMIDSVSSHQEAEKLQTLLQPTTDFYTNVANDKEASEARLYTFELRTHDGDVVNVRSYADKGARVHGGRDTDGSTRQVDKAGMEDFSFSVEGNLDVDELRAINGLLAQINDVADTFFNGDVYDAFNKALDVGYDSEEIARFSLSLTQTGYRRVENAYGSVAKPDIGRSAKGAERAAEQNRVGQLGNFMHQLEQLQQRAKPFGFKQQLPDLAQFIAKPHYGDHPHFRNFGPFVGHMMNSFGRT